MKKLKAVIYCRVSDENTRDLLGYQEKELSELSQYLDMKIISSIKEVAGGKSFGTYAMQKLIQYIVGNKTDAILVYDKTRLVIYDDLYEEFQMICDKYDVDIFTINDMKSMIFANSIFNSHD